MGERFSKLNVYSSSKNGELGYMLQGLDNCRWQQVNEQPLPWRNVAQLIADHSPDDPIRYESQRTRGVAWGTTIDRETGDYTINRLLTGVEASNIAREVVHLLSGEERTTLPKPASAQTEA